MQTLQIMEYSTQRILTTAQLAEAYGTTAHIIQSNFSHNKERFTPGKHYFCLEGTELKSFLTTSQNAMSSNSRINKLYLWTEKGALLHAKSVNTEKAWEIYEQLVDEYYRLVKTSTAAPAVHTLTETFRPRADCSLPPFSLLPLDKVCIRLFEHFFFSPFSGGAT